MGHSTLSADEITEKKPRPAAFTYDSRTLTLEDGNTLNVGAQDDLDAVRALDDAENLLLNVQNPVGSKCCDFSDDATLLFDNTLHHSKSVYILNV